ncbi:hypothetical protein BBBOND_0100520 [Babesia bigemina]|uniref:Uncharacterized protein n=1 Tax=Babesia bigemina TaxID=5866 RepID=A0A061CZ54_BABBI|nr:hypothetical protein BBBOND_0100520 [Babesia bigemina]CDR93723.1 hypothetical protein BBBOND_0100520 [Babesia bigemina]|eukprot:XP_012765909.1 hypothetical protein BBBOND_0100520 [Babesia bigemina]
MLRGVNINGLAIETSQCALLATPLMQEEQARGTCTLRHQYWLLVRRKVTICAQSAHNTRQYPKYRYQDKYLRRHDASELLNVI